MREEKLKQKRKSPSIAGSFAYKFPLILFADLRQRLPGQRTVRDLAIVAGEPGLANFFLERVIGINRRQIVRAPRTRIEAGQHQKWIKIRHCVGQTASGNQVASSGAIVIWPME